MSRLDIITVIIVGICLAALGYLLFKTYELMQAPEDGVVSTAPIGTDDEYADTRDTYDPYGDEEPTGGSATTPDIDNTTDFGTNDAVTSPSFGGRPVTPAGANDSEFDNNSATTGGGTAAEPVTEPTPAPAARATDYSDGRYMVLAGSFRQKSGAEDRARTLRQAGFANARTEIFNGGAFAVVLVDRFSSLSAANKLSGQVKAKGYDAFVKEQE